MFAWWGRAWCDPLVVARGGRGAGTGRRRLGRRACSVPSAAADSTTRRASRPGPPPGSTEEFGPQGQRHLVLYTSADGHSGRPGLAAPGAAGHRRPGRTAPRWPGLSVLRHRRPACVSTDRHATYVAIQLREGDATAKLADLAAIRPLLAAGGESRPRSAASIAFLDDANKQIESDIVRAEMISLPIVLILLILIFRGLVAARMPLLVGVRRHPRRVHRDPAAGPGHRRLGLRGQHHHDARPRHGIDYALFVVSRFREELAAGHDTAEAVRRTIATAGRTVVVSGLTVALALSSLLLFPRSSSVDGRTAGWRRCWSRCSPR